VRVAGSFDYIFHFISVHGKNAKKLYGIYELGTVSSEAPPPEQNDHEKQRGWYVREICRYDFAADDWQFTNNISKEKYIRGIESDSAAFAEFAEELEKLAAGGRQK
jgi:hypothetical protein